MLYMIPLKVHSGRTGGGGTRGATGKELTKEEPLISPAGLRDHWGMAKTDLRGYLCLCVCGGGEESVTRRGAGIRVTNSQENPVAMTTRIWWDGG